MNNNNNIKLLKSRYDFNRNKYFEIVGYLKAYAQLNIFSNHDTNYILEYGDFNQNIENSMDSFFRKYLDDFEEYDEVEYDFKQIANWQEEIHEILSHYFLEVLQKDYTSKNDSTDYHRQHCINTFIEMLVNFFENTNIEVWISGTLASGMGSCLGEYFPYESSTDIIFVKNKIFFLLHFGHFD